MASSYSSTLRIELIGTGDQSGTWGNTTNSNLGALIEQAITGVTSVDVTAADVTLTALNGAVDQARSAVLIATGTNVVTRNIVIPNVTKTYIVTNSTTQTLGIKTASGSAFSCTAGYQSLIYCNGSNVVTGAVINTPPTTLTGTTLVTPTITTPAVTGGTFLTPTITTILEPITVAATAATGSINFDALTQSVIYYTSNAAANWALNFRGNGSTSLNTMMSTGQVVSATFMVTQGTTAYYSASVYIDGVAVTPKWQGGTAPTTGNVSSVDVYTYAIVKTGSAAFSVFASQSQFK